MHVVRPICDEPQMPCTPSPCGPNSQCREVGSTAVCSCLPNYIGRAPNCRPECTINSECPTSRACINERCKDPCPGACGISAYCNVINHSPVCTCGNGYTGDPFSGCYPIPSKILVLVLLFISIYFLANNFFVLVVTNGVLWGSNLVKNIFIYLFRNYCMRKIINWKNFISNCTCT